MDLFYGVQTPVNLLPCDGQANYYGPVLTPVQAEQCFQALLAEVLWQQDSVQMFGNIITTARKVAWYGDGGSYSYSGTTKQALPWTPQLSYLKAQIESLTCETFNACLLNLYHDGSEGVGWHSDNEPELVENAAIASVSLGAERRFLFKHRQSGQRIAVQLETGSLLVMQGATQRCWLHQLPKSKKVLAPRINLTFRQMKT